MKCNTIMAIIIDKRSSAAPKVQEILTKFGCIVKVRLGVHEVDVCKEDGLILLQLCGSLEEINKLEGALGQLHLVKVKKMEI